MSRDHIRTGLCVAKRVYMIFLRDSCSMIIESLPLLSVCWWGIWDVAVKPAGLLKIEDRFPASFFVTALRFDLLY